MRPKLPSFPTVVVALLALLVGAGGLQVYQELRAAETRSTLGTGSQLYVSTGTADIDISVADYTSATVLLTIAPKGNSALNDVRVVFDLDKTTSGWNDLHSTETISFLVSRKVDGTNWRPAANTATSTVTGTAANARSIDLVIGQVGPNEQVRVEVLLSAEVADTELPFVLYYRSTATATVTPVGA